MATTVNQAFLEFMRDTVNLNPTVTSNAILSRDNLLENISEFNADETFFELCSTFNVHFGSFARKTKCRELDDIDLMIGIAANGATYNSSQPWNNVTITSSKSNKAQIDCTDDDGSLNSRRVVNRFKKKLETVREYSRSDIKRNGEAVVLNLISKEWSFDIVPCFHTVKEDNGKDYYLIPNGIGNWKKTDPTIDRKKIVIENQRLDGRVLELIRLLKRWNNTKNASTIPSYLLEVLVLNHSEMQNELSQWLDIRFKDALAYISAHIFNSIYDPKAIQGDINSLSLQDRIVLSQKAEIDHQKACDAISFETSDKDHKKSISKWQEIFGGDFPRYE